MDLASLSWAIQNIWLAARAEGMGWVSMFRPQQLAQLLNMPSDDYPAAILCLGHVESFYPEPLLKTQGWDHARELDDILYQNRWDTACPLD